MGFQPPLPFWRLTVIQSTLEKTRFVLCFCFHHSLADTKSALRFLEDSELALSTPTSSEAGSLVRPCTLDLHPPLKLLKELPTSPEYVHFQQHLGEPPENVWSGGPQAKPSATRFSSISLRDSATLKLRQRCKFHGAFITSGLMSLMALSLFDVLPPEYVSLYGDCAVSLRNFLPEPVTSQSRECYVGSFGQVYQRKPGSLWDEAKTTKNTIDETLAGMGENMPVGYLRHIPNLKQWFEDKMGQRRWAAFELSNVGALSSPETAETTYQIEDVIFSQSASACSGAIKVSVVSGRTGNLSLGFSWQKGVVEDEMVKEVMARMGRRINDML